MQRLKEMGYCRSDDRLPDQALTEDPHIGLVSGMRAGFAIWRGWVSQASGIAIPLKTGPGSLLAITRDCPLVFSVPRLKPGGGHRRTRATTARLPRQWGRILPGWHGHGDDPIVTLVEALSGCRTFVWGANDANIGQIQELPADAVVELAARLWGWGSSLSSPTPPVLVGTVAPHVVRQKAIIDIALDRHLRRTRGPQ